MSKIHFTCRKLISLAIFRFVYFTGVDEIDNIFKLRNRRLRKSTLLLKYLKINIFCLNETIHNGNMTKTYVWLQRKNITKIKTIHLCLKETDYRFTLSVNTRHDIIPLHA